MVTGLESLDQPAERLDANMGVIRAIMDPPRGRMGYQNIQVASVRKPIPKETRNQPDDMLPHLKLRILKFAAGAITNAALNTSDEKPLPAGYTAVQIGTPVWVCTFTVSAVLYFWVMISMDKEKRHI